MDTILLLLSLVRMMAIVTAMENANNRMENATLRL